VSGLWSADVLAATRCRVKRPTAASGCKKRRDAAPCRAYSLRQRPLRTQLDGDLARKILPLQLLVRAQIRHDHSVDLAVFGQQRKAAAPLGAGIVGHGRKRVKGLGSAVSKCRDQSRFIVSVIPSFPNNIYLFGTPDLHAIPHNPNPALSNTEPLLMSATASSALFHTFEPPRPRAGTATDLLPTVECENPLLPAQWASNLTPGAALNALITPPTIPNCREHACRTTNPGSGAVCLTTRATPAILPVFCKKLAYKQTQHSNVSIVASPRSQKKQNDKLFIRTLLCSRDRDPGHGHPQPETAVVVLPPGLIGAKRVRHRGQRGARNPDFGTGEGSRGASRIVNRE
jgi:hypothetical protein